MKFSEKIYKFQEGGPMPAEVPAAPEAVPAAPEAAPAAPQGGEEQLQQLAGQLVEALMQQIGDPQAAMMVLQMAMDMLGQAVNAQAPAYQKQGGRLIRIR